MKKNTNKPSKTLILVDEEIESDRRVLSVIANYHNPQIINCKKTTNLLNKKLSFYKKILNAVSALGMFFRFFFNSLNAFNFWAKLFLFCKPYNKKIFSGFYISFRSYVEALNTASLIMQDLDDIDFIYCNDLFCGIVAHKISKKLNVNFIYDAHEVEFNRNRKNSWFRSALDSILEKEIIIEATKVFVVNLKIANMYRSLYRPYKNKIFIKANNHFNIINIKIYTESNKLSKKNPTIIYVGGGTSGRQLENLALESKKYSIPVCGFFIYEIPKIAIDYNWFIGRKKYESELINLIISRRCIMWCCIDNICLSYNLALPNKFFQAIAAGIPVIVSSDTYLAEIVEKYQLGFIYNQKNFWEFIEVFNSDLFCNWIKNINDFRLQYSLGKIVL